MPIGHVVTFTFTPDITAEVIASLFESLNAVAAACDGVETYFHGEDLSLRDGNADYAIGAVFRDQDALAAYTNAPEHRRVNAEFKRFIAQKSSVQFAVPALTNQP